jgi:hypothetical protein
MSAWKCKDSCVGCGTPLVDETMKGDLTDNPLIFLDRINKNFAKVVAGSNNGCRNCTVALDALSFIFKSMDQKKFQFTIASQGQRGTLSIGCSIDRDFIDGRNIEPTRMEVFRQTGMSG